jgi:hypothetical protein
VRLSAGMFCVCLVTACKDGGEVDVPPILDRSSRELLSCEVTSELRDFGLFESDVDAYGSKVTRLAGDELWVVRMADGDVRGRPRLVVSPLTLTGERGEDRLVDEGGQGVTARELIALPGGGFAVLWIRNDFSQQSGSTYSLWFAAFDAAGAATVGARQVEGIQPQDGFPLQAAVSSAGNVGVLHRGADGSTQLATLDSVGDPWGDTREALRSVTEFVAAPDGGFVMLGRDNGPDGRLGDALLFLKIEETSELRAEPVPVAQATRGHTFWQGTTLVPLERGYLVAWTEARHPPGPNPWEYSTGGHSIIRIRRLDENGAPLAAAAALREQRDSVAERRPVLALFGDHVAVFWSTGPYNYDCEMAEACWHRDRGQFILIDPDDLTPRSELIEVLRDPAYPNGQTEPRLGDLLGTALSVRDGEVLVTATLQDDDDQRLAPGFASVRCR